MYTEAAFERTCEPISIVKAVLYSSGTGYETER